MTKVSLVGRVDTLRAQLAPRSDFDARADEAMRRCERVLGVPFDELDADDLHRIEQLLKEAPDFAHPLLLRACLDHPEDHEPPLPKGQWCPTTLRWFRPDTPEWRAYANWQRRHSPAAADDPEAQELLDQIEAWATSPDRRYLRGADLRFLLTRLGVARSKVSCLELKRLLALCAALDELALEEPELEVPLGVYWSVIGWEEHNLKRPAVGRRSA